MSHIAYNTTRNLHDYVGIICFCMLYCNWLDDASIWLTHAAMDVDEDFGLVGCGRIVYYHTVCCAV